MKVLILFAHPAFQKSRINRELVYAVKPISGITFNDLYEQYPEFDINVNREKELLLEHDCIILQHPMFWYSAPSILKEWLDIVLEHGWAYGSKGDALKGKLFFNSVTTGGPRQAFQPEGMHRHTLTELLVPFSLTAGRCQMIYLPPFAVHGTYAMEDEELKAYVNSYKSLLMALRDDRFDARKALKLKYLNEYKIKDDN